MYDKRKLIIMILATVPGGKNYIPHNNLDFALWAQSLYDYANENHARFGIVAVEPDILTRLQAFQELVLRCKDSNHIKADEVERNAARKVVEKEVRNFVQGVLVHNTKVSERDREIMKIPVYDTIRTSVGAPVGQAIVVVSFPGRAQLKVHINHVEDTPYDAKADYGCRVYMKVCAHGETPPAAGTEITESRFTRRKILKYDFPTTDTGKTAYFCVRYENGKGDAGQWGPMVSAVIP